MAEDNGFRPAAWQRGWMDERSPSGVETDKEHRLAAWQRGADTGRRTAQGQMLRLLKEKLHTTQFLAKWATADGLPSDFWDARAAAYMDMIGELEGRDGRGWWQ